jgi:N-acetylglucosaminyldiphosphoundecaprenol N-acetyl-beta-D-mannosaminyltransferase
MLHVLEMASKENIPVGFYGGKAEVLELLVEKMKRQFPNLHIVHYFSPPFRELSEEEDNKVCKEIQNNGVRILFVGLGCPKQERWMSAHKGKIDAVMLGVGAAFDFHAGIRPQAPSWMQAVGLEWLFRLLHEPRRLARRYLYNNPRFVLLALADLLGILEKGKQKE